MACEAVLTTHGSLDLDVAGLRFVDSTGVDLLHRLERQGIELKHCSPFVGELLREHAAAPAVPAAASDGSDAPLVERLRRNDPEAFETMVRQYGGRMLATARRFVGSEDDARDVTQEAFLAAFRSIDGFAGTARLSTWLHRIVINAALMKLRNRRRRREDSIDDLLPRFAEDGSWADPASCGELATDALVDREQTRLIVRKAIDRLPANYRSVLLLRDIEELDTDETAALLGITPNATKVRLHRARQALRTILQKELRG